MHSLLRKIPLASPSPQAATNGHIEGRGDNENDPQSGRQVVDDTFDVQLATAPSRKGGQNGNRAAVGCNEGAASSKGAAPDKHQGSVPTANSDKIGDECLYVLCDACQKWRMLPTTYKVGQMYAMSA